MGIFMSVVAIVFFIVMYIAYLHQYGEKVAKIKKDYYVALEQLRLDPYNRQKYDRALELGKKHTYLSGQIHVKGGYEHEFAEANLINEVNMLVHEAKETQAKTSVEERLQKLEELHTKGLISKQEYQERRDKILDTI